MNAYTIRINIDGEEQEINLRLTLGAQEKLEKKYNQNAMATLYDAIDKASVLAAVMTEALNFKGNTNPVKDGAVLYDLLVDNGYAGVEAFAELSMGIAHASGLVSEKQAVATVNRAKGVVDEALGTEETPKN